LIQKKIMKLKGLQKTTLIDYPGKIACTLFLFGCNFRCGFCHNPELVLDDDSTKIQEKEVLEFLEKRRGYLDGVCITGGEPLLTLEENFVKKIKEMGYAIKIDTNGSFPEKLKRLLEEGLIDFVAMDIKASKEKYSEVAAVNVDVDKIEESIRIISRLNDYEFRTTILTDVHGEEEMKKISLWLNEIAGKKPKKYALQGFKNRGKILSRVFENEKDVAEQTLQNLKEKIKDYFEVVEIRE